MPIVGQIFLLLVLAEAVFGKIWWPGDLRSIQDELLEHARGLDKAVQACASLDASTKAQWAEFLTRVTYFAQTQYGYATTTFPDGHTILGGGDKNTADHCQALTKELYDWGTKIEGSQCALVAPNVKPPEDKPPIDPALMTALKYAAVIAGFVGSAYTVGQIASTIRLFKASPSSKG